MFCCPPPSAQPPLPPQEGKQLFPRSVVNKETGSKPQTCRCGLMCARWRMDPPTFCRLPSKEQILSSQSRPSPIASPGGRGGGRKRGRCFQPILVPDFDTRSLEISSKIHFCSYETSRQESGTTSAAFIVPKVYFRRPSARFLAKFRKGRGFILFYRTSSKSA